MIRQTPKEKSKGLKKSPLRKVSKKQAIRNKELAKIPPPADFKCQDCGNPADFRGLQKHHIKFRSQGGKDNLENIVWLCGKCHSKKHGIIEK